MSNPSESDLPPYIQTELAPLLDVESEGHGRDEGDVAGNRGPCNRGLELNF
jgi:hypothetical protein